MCYADGTLSTEKLFLCALYFTLKQNSILLRGGKTDAP